jgi:hypothetical protein
VKLENSDSLQVQYEGLEEIKPLLLGFAPNNMFNQDDKIAKKINEIITKVNLLMAVVNTNIGR